MLDALKKSLKDPTRKGPSGQKAKSRTGNSHASETELVEGKGHRQIAYGPWWWQQWNSQKPIVY